MPYSHTTRSAGNTILSADWNAIGGDLQAATTRTYYPEEYGAVPDAFGQDGTTTSASATFTVATGRFTAGDVGKTIVILRGGPSSAQPHHSTISAYVSPTQITMANNAGRSVAGVARYYYGSDNTTAIQSAIDDCTAAGGGVVQLSAAGYLVSTLTIKNRVTIAGHGRKMTYLHQLAATNAPVIVNELNETTLVRANYTVIRDLTIDGNRARQSAYATFPSAGNPRATEGGPHGIQLSGPSGVTYASEDNGSDAMDLLQDVQILNCKGIGFMSYGNSERRLRGVQTEYCDIYGFQVGYDTNLMDCIASLSGYAGFWSSSSSVRFVGCKSWYNGAVSTTNGHGYHMEGQTGGGATCLTGCEAQDNKGSGFYLHNCRQITMASCIADNNNNSSGTGGEVSATGAAGWVLDGAIDCVIESCTSGDTYTRAQGYALLMIGQARHNRVSITHYARSYITDNPIHTSSTSVSGNKVSCNNQEGHQAIALTGSTLAGAESSAATVLEINSPANQRGLPGSGSIITVAGVTGTYTVLDVSEVSGTQYKVTTTAGLAGAASSGAAVAITTFAPRIYDGTLIELVMPASGTLTIGAPSAASKGHEGCMVTFLITRPTGSTAALAWNAVWRVGSVGTVPTANTTKAYSFFCYDGSSWRLMYDPVETAA
jgi:parallel beta-helix repeat protein